MTKVRPWVLVLGALVVVGLVVLAVTVIVPRFTQCGTDVDDVDGECVGVTDGSAPLAPEFGDILGKIREENERVRTSGASSVSVAYLLPMPQPGSPTALELPVLRHELEGALIGQMAANQFQPDGRVPPGVRPLVRLLVANVGDSAKKQSGVVRTLTAMAVGDRFDSDRLVAVVATGQSRQDMQNALSDLTDAGVPVITSRLTADQIIRAPNESSPLARIAPLNIDEATVAARYARTNIGPRGLLVQNADPGDTYANSLGRAFDRAFYTAGGVMLKPSETYRPGRDGVVDIGTMNSVLNEVCAQKPDVVFFAGRASELLLFVAALPSRNCLDRRITVVTADDAVDFAAKVADPVAPDLGARDGLAAKANAQVVFAGEASPGPWDDPAVESYFSPGALTHFRPDCTQQCFSTVFPRESLEDGGAIMGHDAVTTATAAIRHRGVYDAPDLVANQIKTLHGREAVALASGWLSVRANGDQLATTANPVDADGRPINATGAPVAKAVPVLRVQADGHIGYIEAQVMSSASTGVPCLPNSDAC